tara:strand:+ start:100 stop:504 length:405 start_codon:yes stop_codon:yes gene_type:complete
MPRKKKLYNYEFKDVSKSFERTVEVICTQTGERVKMYHKHLAKLIEKKYSNRWNVFKHSYIKKGNRIKREDDPVEYDTRPEGYRRFLIGQYLHFKDNKDYSNSYIAGKLAFVNDCYQKRWNETIDETLKRSKTF